MSNTIIKLDKISKHIPTGSGKTYLLKHIDLQVNEGDFLSIMGPSGSGKSTLLHILGLLDEASEGTYTLQGEEVQSWSEKKKSEMHRSTIGFVFQAYHLIDELTVYENIETPLLYNKVPKAERQSRIADILDRFNMVAKKDLFPAQLSGGQQQLVGVARALINNPKILFADEPTGNLHSAQAKEIMELFREINQKDGVTIIQVTHSEENASYGTKTIELNDGYLA